MLRSLSSFRRLSSSDRCTLPWAYCHWYSDSVSGRTGLDAVADAALNCSEPTEPTSIPTLLAAAEHHKNHKFKVAIFQSAGDVSVTEKTGAELGVQVRDMPMFTKPRNTGQDARITIRDDKILMRTEVLRAIVQRNSMVLFECRKQTLSEKVGLSILHSLKAARQRPDRIPFELQALELLLEQSVKYLEDKANKIKLLSRAVQEHVSKHVNMAEIRRLLPLQKAVTALEYDIREMKEAVAHITENEKKLALLCLTEDQNLTKPQALWTPHMQLAHRLLTAYDSRIRALDSDLRELTEHIDSTREVWHMQLDAMRNNIIRFNLHLEFAGLSTMVAALPAAMFGMNLLSGWEDVDGLFWKVGGCSVASGLVIYSALVLALTWWPRSGYKQRMADMTALHDLLTYNVDDISDVVQALTIAERKQRGGLGKAEFSQIVYEVLGYSATDQVHKEKLDLLYRVLDADKDGYLDPQELARVHQDIIHRGYQ